MRTQETTGRVRVGAGLVTITISAEAFDPSSLPDWVDTKAVYAAAEAEAERQKTEATGDRG